MSIQFRSRIKSTADYSTDLSDQGICCYPDGNSSDNTSYSQCIDDNGYFQYGEETEDIKCPSISDTGCCCACSYVDSFEDYMDSIDQGESDYSGGLADDISFCECSSIGGVWLGANQSCSKVDDIFGFCTRGKSENPQIPDPIEYDVRFPQGCCVDLGDGGFECYDVCSGIECGEKQTDVNPDGTATHHPDVACDDPTDDDGIMCGDVGFRKLVEEGGLSTKKDGVFSVGNNTSVDKIFTENDPSIFSACVRKDSCQIKKAKDCDGFWMGIKDGIPLDCSDDGISPLQEFIKTKTVSRSVVDGWKIGDYKFGGFYLGEFYGYGGQEAFGNLDTGIGKLYTTKPDKKELKGFTKNNYAIITHWSAMEYKFGDISSKFTHTSTNDSLLNSSIDFPIMDDIKNDINSNGISDGFPWVIPSLNLSSFINNKLLNDAEGIKINKLWLDALNSINTFDPPINPCYPYIIPGMGFVAHKQWTSTLVPGTESSPMVFVQDFSNGSTIAAQLNDIYYARPVLVVKIVQILFDNNIIIVYNL